MIQRHTRQRMKCDIELATSISQATIQSKVYTSLKQVDLLAILHNSVSSYNVSS